MTRNEWNWLQQEIGYYYWYWKGKAKHKKKFTGLDIFRFLMKNSDNADLRMVRSLLLRDYDLPRLYQGNAAPGTFAYTTWELVQKTMTWTGNLWADVHQFMAEGAWPWKLIRDAKYHREHFNALYNAWLAHYYRMIDKDELAYDQDKLHPYPDEIKDDPWWLF